jgi:hypothetical protein
MSIKSFFQAIGRFLFGTSKKSQTQKTPGQLARDLGIQQSIDSANSVVKNWSDVAYGFLLGYADSHKEFMIEDMRIASNGFVPEPPSKRAWGGIAVRAAKNGIIRRKGFRNVKNVRAHCTPATLWEVV